MIVDGLNDLEKYIEAAHCETIFAFLDKVKKEEVKTGEWIMLDNEMKGLVLTASNYAAGVFEAHTIYRDIHIVLEGSDTLFLGGPDGLVKAEYEEKGDYTLYTSSTVAEVKLHKNMFALIKQGQIHSNVITGDSSKKVVIKIK